MSRMRWVALVLIGLAVALMSIGPKEAEQSATAMLADGTDSATVAELKAKA